MRISDWSSDVCSSDLAQNRPLSAVLADGSPDARPLPCCFTPTFSSAGGLLVRKAVATVKPARYEAAGRGAVAQTGERCNRTAEVRGSIPLGSTTTLFLTCQSVSFRPGSCSPLGMRCCWERVGRYD